MSYWIIGCTLFITMLEEKAMEFRLLSISVQWMCTYYNAARALIYNCYKNAPLIFIKSIENILLHESTFGECRTLVWSWQFVGEKKIKLHANLEKLHNGLSISLSLSICQFIFITRARKILCSKLEMAHLTYWCFWLAPTATLLPRQWLCVCVRRFACFTMKCWITIGILI